MSEHQMCTHKSSPKNQRTVIGTGDFAHLVLMQKCVKLPGRECVYSPSESRSIRASIRPQTPARVVQTCQSRSAFLQKPKHLKNMTIFWSFSLFFFFLLISTSTWDKIKKNLSAGPQNFTGFTEDLEASKGIFLEETHPRRSSAGRGSPSWRGCSTPSWVSSSFSPPSAQIPPVVSLTLLRSPKLRIRTISEQLKQNNKKTAILEAMLFHINDLFGRK